MEKKYLNSERCVQNLMAALEEKERETTAFAKKLQDQVLKNLETVKQLQEEMQRLGFEKTCLEATVQQQSSRIEALQRERQATTSAQAASQERLEHIKASHHASRRNQLKDRIGHPECELDKIKKDSTRQYFPKKKCAQAEVEEDKELYPEEAKTRRCLAKKVERAKESLDKANAKHLWKRLKKQSSVTGSTVRGGLAAAPVLRSSALGHLGSHSGLDSSVSAGDSLQRQHKKCLSSRRRLVASVAKVQLEQEEKLSKKMEKGLASPIFAPLDIPKVGTSRPLASGSHPTLTLHQSAAREPSCLGQTCSSASDQALSQERLELLPPVSTYMKNLWASTAVRSPPDPASLLRSSLRLHPPTMCNDLAGVTGLHLLCNPKGRQSTQHERGCPYSFMGFPLPSD
ncbi:uncharacterized protein LOC130264680 [Oenanthe melanoleuca]|uniref:uncharacterized protein LOC130264680 n=1 Tax=Oenanthe melanoleuca TaxID=2939378 RepID=UPI0024C203C5|nr:uncharacterized protein LOC130264680 [Oenanthe melanoleuca]